MEYVLNLSKLIGEVAVLCLQLVPLLIVFVDLSLALLHHPVKVEDALFQTGQSVVLQLLRSGQIILLPLLLVDIAFQFFLNNFKNNPILQL